MTIKILRSSSPVITIFLSFVILYAFYGNLFNKLNNVTFAASGDGMQSYVNMEYHIKYDSTYMRCNSMNYPYGEHVFFANNQPLISNTIKFISDNIFDISDYTLGILNFIMLFCLVITPILLFYIFDHLGTGKIISIVASLTITYLSPQLDRFGGHFNLCYVCAIPLMILLLLKFFSKPKLWLSVIISLTMIAGALTHFYIYGFYALLMIFFYCTYLYKNTGLFKNRMIILIHLFIQLILPFIIIQAFYISDNITDRPSYPWGFLYYRAYPQSIFLPFGRPYGQFLYSILNINYIDWEGYAFIGMVAFIGTLYFTFIFIKKLSQKKFNQLLLISKDNQLNIIFWASFAGLLYSFGLPFILGLQWLVDLIGPLRQMRGIARFSWVFFYVMNIVTVYWIWNWYKEGSGKYLKIFVLIAVMLMLTIDMYYNVRARGRKLENYIPELVDKKLEAPENQWIRRIDLKKYQAFIPLPYFHIGSENIWLDGGCEIVNKSLITIKNSGLPCMGVSLSRTSISQTLNNISLVQNPSCDNINIKIFPSQKPFLLLVAPCDMLNWHEKELVKKASMIDSSGVFHIYELPFNSFQLIKDSISKVILKELDNNKLYKHGNLLSDSSVKNFVFIDFDSLNNNSGLYKSGCFEGIAKENNLIYDGFVNKNDTSKSFILSFWINDIRIDLYPRTNVNINEFDKTGIKINNVSYPISKHMAVISGNYAMIEYTFRMIDNSNDLKIYIQNKTLRKKPIKIDNLLIRHSSENIYFKRYGYIWKNNKYYCIP